MIELKKTPPEIVEEALQSIAELNDKIFPAFVPEIEAPFPCVVYVFTGDTLVDSLRGQTLAMRRHLTFEVVVLASTVHEAYDLAEKVTGAIDATGKSDPSEYTGPSLDYNVINPDAPGDVVQQSAYSCTMTYGILY